MMRTSNKLFSSSSSDIDQRFGFKINDIEEVLLLKAKKLRPQGTVINLGDVLHQGHQTWVGLDPQTLNTPYAELEEICRLLNPTVGELVLDLGAAYGRLGLVLHYLYPGVKFLGHELVHERVEEGNRIFKKHGCTQANLLSQDLMATDFELPIASYYFIYDFGKVAHIRFILNQLEQMADHHHFKVIARGKASQSIIEYEHPWLSQIYPVERGENYSIYSY